MNWFNDIIKSLEKKDLEKNVVDKTIMEKLPGGDNEHVQEVYKARWVWYHTILAVEIAFTNILLIAILLAVVLK